MVVVDLLPEQDSSRLLQLLLTNRASEMTKAESDCDLKKADVSLAVTLCSAAPNCFEKSYGLLVIVNFALPACRLYSAEAKQTKAHVKVSVCRHSDARHWQCILICVK